MGRFLATIVVSCVSMVLLTGVSFAADCGKCQSHQSNKCGLATDCNTCEPKCESKCRSCEPKCEATCNHKACGSKIDVRHGSGSLQDLLPAQSCRTLIDLDCCPESEYDLLRCASWVGYTLCCTQDNFELLCDKCPGKCDESCKPSKPKCRQSTCHICN